MAIIFELSALCHGAAERDAFVRHIDGIEHELTTTGRTIRWKSQPDTIYSPFAVTGHAAGLSNRGVRTVVDALEVTEAGLRLSMTGSAPRPASATRSSAGTPATSHPTRSWNG